MSGNAAAPTRQAAARQFTGSPERHFTATAFVYWEGKVLLHWHRKLQRWLPCGGHIEPGETPDEAARREVLEESGVEVELVGDRALAVEDPVQLVRPRGVQVEFIGPDHEHIDLIYFARPKQPYGGQLDSDEPGLGWYDEKEVAALDLDDEMRQWTELIFREMGGGSSHPV